MRMKHIRNISTDSSINFLPLPLHALNVILHRLGDAMMLAGKIRSGMSQSAVQRWNRKSNVRCVTMPAKEKARKV